MFNGTEFIQILEPEWDWEGKTYRVKGKYLPLTNPKYGVCLEEYDGKPKLEMFEDDAGFETVAKKPFQTVHSLGTATHNIGGCALGFLRRGPSLARR